MSTAAIEEALTSAKESKRGIIVFIAGQTVGGAVVSLQSGSHVELRNQEFGRIVVRIDRIDGVALP